MNTDSLCDFVKRSIRMYFFFFKTGPPFRNAIDFRRP